MNKKELQQTIKLGEGFNAEFKKSFSAGIGREICAFANSLGGKIFVGVDDKGNISGIKNKNRIKSSIQSISRKKEDLGKISRPRNPLLFNLMYRMDLVEQIGSGILRINNALAGYGMSPPDIESDNGWYGIVFKRSASVKNGVKTDGFDKASDQNATVNATVNLTAIQKDIIKQVQDNPNVTYNILADLLKKNRTTIFRNMQKLKQVNILERIGSDKKGCWKIIIK